ncbi:hypothetical protein [Deinococcus sp. QL22]|uniref:hypothetical protein n=1 Tax=Deinococcus sp. QL22 TaxID=2939437 RepID=UPI0020181372|nr:hypothetical protein [Deinococcus sp. QL22]UQN09440.1 hypothetical protein M1R55_23065 [Deinococcus sp. QL22]
MSGASAPVIQRTSALIWEQVQAHSNLVLRASVQDLLTQLQMSEAQERRQRLLDGLDRALRTDSDDRLIVARAHLSALRGVLDEED